MIRQQMKKQMETMKTSLGAMTANFPKKAVAPGDTWTTEGKSQGSMGMKVKRHYTFEGEEEGQLAIAIKSNIDVEGKPMERGGADAEMTMEGKSEGKMFVNPDNGWVTKSNAEQEMSGSMTLQRGSQERNMPMDITTTIKLTSKPIE
jgi:S-adenosylmethionine hydrolase